MSKKTNGGGCLAVVVGLILVVIFLPVMLIGFLGIGAGVQTIFEFHIDTQYLNEAYKYSLQDKGKKSNWIDLITYGYLNAKEENEISNVISEGYSKILSGKKLLEKDESELRDKFKFVLDGIVGNGEVRVIRVTYSSRVDPETGEIIEERSESIEKQKFWGKKAYYPIPAGYISVLNNDFGDERSFADITSHDGNDIMANTNVPIINVEEGFVENIGWNEAGGWRIGIRTKDKKRYIYYAHMERYVSGIKKGDFIEAGEVIGYVGDTGYGPQGTRGKFEPHLHFGIQVKYEDEAEPIWVNPFPYLDFLKDNKVNVFYNGNDYERQLDVVE